MPPPAHVRSLASCHGYEAVADDGSLGEVETPIFPPGSDIPDYLSVRSVQNGSERRLLVAIALVNEIDKDHRFVQLRGSIGELSRLPSSLPLARRL